MLRTLAFGGVAALGSIPWAMVFGSFFGHSWALAGYGLAAAASYAAVIAPSWPRGVAAGAAAGAAAGVTLVLATTPSEAILGAALILAVARSGFLYRGRPARTVVLEAALTCGGLLFARALAGPTVLSAGLAIWAFFLVQSLFFLAGGVREREADEPQIDRFERARKRALALMEEPSAPIHD